MKTVSVEQVDTSEGVAELALPPRVQAALGELAPVLLRAGGEGEDLRAGLLEHGRGFREALLELADDATVLLVHGVGVRLREDRADERGDERLRGLGHARLQVADEVRAAVLPGGALERRRDRVDEAGVGVRGDEEDAGEAARDEPPEEGEPTGAILLGDDLEAERLPVAVAVDADRVDDADVDRLPALAAADDEGVEHQVGVGSAIERPGAEVLDQLVQRLRQARDVALRPPLDPELGDELLDP